MPQRAGYGMADSPVHEASLDSSKQDQDQQNDQDHSNYSGGTIAPARAMRPSRDNAEEDQDQDNDKNGAE